MLILSRLFSISSNDSFFIFGKIKPFISASIGPIFLTNPPYEIVLIPGNHLYSFVIDSISFISNKLRITNLFLHSKKFKLISQEFILFILFILLIIYKIIIIKNIIIKNIIIKNII